MAEPAQNRFRDREPLWFRAALVAAFASVLHAVVVVAGWQIDAGAERAIVGAVDATLILLAAAVARPKVTPSPC